MAENSRYKYFSLSTGIFLIYIFFWIISFALSTSLPWLVSGVIFILGLFFFVFLSSQFKQENSSQLFFISILYVGLMSYFLLVYAPAEFFCTKFLDPNGDYWHRDSRKSLSLRQSQLIWISKMQLCKKNMKAKDYVYEIKLDLQTWTYKRLFWFIANP